MFHPIAPCHEQRPDFASNLCAQIQTLTETFIHETQTQLNIVHLPGHSMIMDFRISHISCVNAHQRSQGYALTLLQGLPDPE